MRRFFTRFDVLLATGGNGDCSSRLQKVWIKETGVIAPTTSTRHNKSAKEEEPDQGKQI
jgi:hypothetical protein